MFPVSFGGPLKPPPSKLDGVRCQSTGCSDEESTTCPGLMGFFAGNDGVITFRCS